MILTRRACDSDSTLTQQIIRQRIMVLVSRSVEYLL